MVEHVRDAPPNFPPYFALPFSSRLDSSLEFKQVPSALTFAIFSSRLHSSPEFKQAVSHSLSRWIPSRRWFPRACSRASSALPVNIQTANGTDWFTHYTRIDKKNHQIIQLFKIIHAFLEYVMSWLFLCLVIFIYDFTLVPSPLLSLGFNPSLPLSHLRAESLALAGLVCDHDLDLKLHLENTDHTTKYVHSKIKDQTTKYPHSKSKNQTTSSPPPDRRWTDWRRPPSTTARPEISSTMNWEEAFIHDT